MREQKSLRVLFLLTSFSVRSVAMSRGRRKVAIARALCLAERFWRQAMTSKVSVVPNVREKRFGEEKNARGTWGV
jgi:hypothetical protein